MRILHIPLILALLAPLPVLAGNAPPPAAPGPSQPAPSFTDVLAGLDGDSYDDRISAVEALGRLGDPRALPALSAMLDGHLYEAPGHGLVYGDPDAGLRSAATGEAVAGLTADDLSEIPVNNRVRGVILGVIGGLSLKSPEAGVRIKAVEALAERQPDGAAAALKGLLSEETDARVRAAAATALALLNLGSPERHLRQEAIAVLATSSDPMVEGRLRQYRDTEKDPDLSKAAAGAIHDISVRLSLIDVGANLFQGLSQGSVLLLGAIGLAITFGVMGVINMAHGEMIMLGAYTTYVVQEAFRAFLPSSFADAYLVVALPAAFLVAGAVGVLLERTLIRHLYGRPLETLLSTWGISLILQQAVRSVFGAPNKEVGNPSWLSGGVDLAGGFTLTWNRLAIILFCLGLLAALAALLRYSRFGLHMRAVSQNRPMASAMGIAAGRVDALTFGLGSGIAGIAGVALSQIGNVSPNLGQGYIVDSFMVVVFGGVGSLWGTLAGALSLGILNKLLEPYAGAMLGKILVLVLIILFIQKRPRGLFAFKGRSVEG